MALQRIASNAQMRGRVKFGQIFLAAPDADRDLFLDLARLYPEHAERTTLYASDGDLPVHLSARLHDIFDLMRHGQQPARHQRIGPTVEDGMSFWKLRK